MVYLNGDLTVQKMDLLIFLVKYHDFDFIEIRDLEIKAEIWHRNSKIGNRNPDFDASLISSQIWLNPVLTHCLKNMAMPLKNMACHILKKYCHTFAMFLFILAICRIFHVSHIFAVATLPNLILTFLALALVRSMGHKPEPHLNQLLEFFVADHSNNQDEFENSGSNRK